MKKPSVGYDDREDVKLTVATMFNLIVYRDLALVFVLAVLLSNCKLFFIIIYIYIYIYMLSWPLHEEMRYTPQCWV